MNYPLLEKINCSDDVSRLREEQLDELCRETRDFIVENVSRTGGHLSSNLGVVEIVTAMHYCFSTPGDSFVFDVGHQCYAHKIYTGRRDDFGTLRQLGGLSGFPSPAESDTDSFVAGHGSTSISVGIGLARAKKLKREGGYVVVLVGDGAFTGGMIYEGLNNIDPSLDNLIVILNDNKMSISKNVGTMSDYFARLRTNNEYLNIKQGVSDALDNIPVLGQGTKKVLVSMKSFVRRNMYMTGTFFEDLGFTYHLVNNGNDVHIMCDALQASKRANGPVFIHTVTVKGKGYPPAEENPSEFHGVGAFDLEKVPDPDMASEDSFSNVFGKNLSELANTNGNLCAITAAMKYGTGLQFFYRDHRARFFDVGMAEEHAVTFRGALAKSGLEPVVCLYSTFMQRAFDQYLQDVKLLNLNVFFGIDRAGLVPGDGETHQGIFDLALFTNYSDTPVVCPSNYEELIFWQKKLIEEYTGAKVLRYPRGGQEKNLENYGCSGNEFDLIKASEIADNLIVCYGRHLSQCLKAQESLEKEGIYADILKLTVVNPIPQGALETALKYKNIGFYEEHVENGGIAVRFGYNLFEMGYKGNYKSHCVKNYQVKRATVPQLWEICGLDFLSIAGDFGGNRENQA